MLFFVQAVWRSQTGASCTVRMEMCSVSPSACLDSYSVGFGVKRRACHLALKPDCLAQGVSAWDTGRDKYVLGAVRLPRMFCPFTMHVLILNCLDPWNSRDLGINMRGAGADQKLSAAAATRPHLMFWVGALFFGLCTKKGAPTFLELFWTIFENAHCNL